MEFTQKYFGDEVSTDTEKEPYSKCSTLIRIMEVVVEKDQQDTNSSKRLNTWIVFMFYNVLHVRNIPHQLLFDVL